MVDFNKGRMLTFNTPVEDWTKEYGLWVKREDQSCRHPGPQFSKTRGVYEHIKARPESTIGVLDTYHSQAGHAVALACQILGKQCVNYYPEYKREPGFRAPQLAAQLLGAELFGIPAGRSSVIYHKAKKLLAEHVLDAYMMPNALKLKETVSETAREVGKLDDFDTVIIPSSSATIAAGVIRGFLLRKNYRVMPGFIIHLGYSRPERAVRKYLYDSVANPGCDPDEITVVDELYNYKDQARDGETPPWPCNPYYDLKAFRWWMRERDKPDRGGAAVYGKTLLWNIG